MEKTFACLTIYGGMFCSDFLHRLLNRDITIEGTLPSDFTTTGNEVTDLEVHLNGLWERTNQLWKTKTTQNEGETSPFAVTEFFEEMMSGFGFELNNVESRLQNDGQPECWYDLKGSLWLIVPSNTMLDEQLHSPNVSQTSAHNLLQSELTSSEQHSWGLLSNGRVLRLLRQTNRPMVQEAIEFDLEKMFTGQHVDDFHLLTLMIHATRWPQKATASMECWLETWYRLSKHHEPALLNELRTSVKLAANALGSGLVNAKAGNNELRNQLQADEAALDELQRQIMRFVYRSLVLFSLEDRELLGINPREGQSTEAFEAARSRYQHEFSTQRFRKNTGVEHNTKGNNYFQEMKNVHRSLNEGNDELALPALGSSLFDSEATPLLNDANLLNSDYLSMMQHLSSFGGNGESTRSIHWKSLLSHMGKVNEGLMEFRPKYDVQNDSFELVNLAGNDRKLSGSYYTPIELVDAMVAINLDPQITEAKHQAEHRAKEKAGQKWEEAYPDFAIEAILRLPVSDPACGSGHFLLVARDRIALELARIETGESHPGPTVVLKWKRVVSSQSIFGVDFNPLAVDMAKVELWIDTYDGTEPLSTFDRNIRFGNSLLGLHIEQMGVISYEAVADVWVNEKRTHQQNINNRQKGELEPHRKRRSTIRRQIEQRQAEAPNTATLDGYFGDYLAARSISGSRDSASLEELQAELAEVDRTIETIEHAPPSSLLKDMLDWDRIRRTVAAEHFMMVEYGQPEEKEPGHEDGENANGEAIEFTQLTVSDLKEILKTRGLAVSGKKAVLIERLLEGDACNQQPPSNHVLMSWVREMLDATMAIWWWPGPKQSNDDEHSSNSVSPLSSVDFIAYTIWLAQTCNVEGMVFRNGVHVHQDFEEVEARFSRIRSMTATIAAKHAFFHWELEFPDIFLNESSASPGFSTKLGNPPWEEIEFKEDEYFSKHQGYDKDQKSSEKKAWIEQFLNDNEHVKEDHDRKKLEVEQTARFFKHSTIYPLVASGKCNLYSLFTEQFLHLINERGRIGIIVPTGIATDEANASLFSHLTEQNMVNQILAFDHRSPHFKNVTMQFCLLSLGSNNRNGSFDVTSGIMDIDEDWAIRSYESNPEMIELVNPTTRTLPLFNDGTHAELVTHVYESSVYWGEPDDEWGIELRQGLFNKANDSALFYTPPELEEQGYSLQTNGTYANQAGEIALQLYESKYFHQFDHRWMSESVDYTKLEVSVLKEALRARDLPVSGKKEALIRRLRAEAFDKTSNSEIQTKFYVKESDVDSRKQDASFPTVVYRLITRSTDPKTCIATMLPKSGIAHSAGVFQSIADRGLILPLLGVLNSSLFNIITKSKYSGANLSFFIVKQLPLPRLEEFNQRSNPKTGNLFRDDIETVVKQLLPTTTRMAEEMGLEKKVVWDEEQRANLKSQLDELVFDYYDIPDKMRDYTRNFGEEE